MLFQGDRQEMLQHGMKPPPPYSEVTMHPVMTNTQSTSSSLLHGILTKVINTVCHFDNSLVIASVILDDFASPIKIGYRQQNNVQSHAGQIVDCSRASRHEFPAQYQQRQWPSFHFGYLVQQ